MQIAIDGPAGAGKSTAAKKLAAELGILYLDTGAMYRAASLQALRGQADFENPDNIAQKALEKKIDFLPDGHVALDGEDVEADIRLQSTAAATSKVACLKPVREALTEQMRRIASSRDIVMDGRDIGTVVLPSADFKFFITASPEERARRRMLELEEKGTLNGKSFETVLEEIRTRDYNDSHRALAPLKQADDAVLILTDSMTPEEVVAEIRGIIGV